MRRTAKVVNGDVLLALDTENLKSEIGIESFHERVMIMKALSELRPEGECVACRAEFC